MPSKSQIHFIILFLTFICTANAFFDPPAPPCNSSDTSCTIEGQNITVQGNLSYVNSMGSVIIQDCYLSCQTFPCSFYLNSSSISLQNTVLNFTEIHLEAATISINSSQVQAVQVITGGPGSPNDSLTGVSYAGQGGYCVGNANKLQYGEYNVIYNDTENYNGTFGSGNSQDTQNSLGGGKIVIVAYSNITVQDTIVDASGFANCSNGVAVNGGTGGYVWLEYYSTSPQSPTISNMTIDVSGGQGCPSSNKTATMNGLGGSGGRVVVVGLTPTSGGLAVVLNGGVNSNMGGNNCAAGAAGTLYLFNEQTVIVTNGNISTQAETILPGVVQEHSLEVSESAVVSFSADSDKVYLNVTVLDLTQATMRYVNINGSLTIETSTLAIASNSQIYSTTDLLNVTSCELFVDQNSGINSYNLFIYITNASGCVLVCSGSFQAYTAIQPSPFTTQSMITVYSYNSSSFQLQNSVQFDLIYFFLSGSTVATFSSNIIESQVKTCYQDSAPPLINPLLLTSDPYSSNNLNLLELVNNSIPTDSISPPLLLSYTQDFISQIYTIFVFAENTLILQSSKASGARFGIFAKNLTFDNSSEFKTTGLGCSEGQGAGLISTDIAGFCPGSGGSYGGQGGPGTTTLPKGQLQEICDSLVGPTYGNIREPPIYEGSGGGGITTALQGGSGGGLIVIGAKSMVMNGKLEADGYTGGFPTGSIAGSGSGGSIQIHTVDRMQGNGSVSAVGGPQTAKGGGGFGGGGRIYMGCMRWNVQDDSDADPDVRSLSFSVANGALIGNNNGTSANMGSVITSICPPGYFGLNCQPCPVGMFKDDFGNGYCRECQNSIGDSYYTNNTETSYLCHYECSDGLVSVADNPFCLSNFFYYTSYIGGIYGVVGASVFILVLVIFILKKNVFQENILKNVGRQRSSENGAPNLGRLHSGELSIKSPKKIRSSFTSFEPWRILSQEDSFLLEDLPYLKHRLYLKGSNTPYNPWFLSEEPPKEICNQVDKKDYLKFAQELNKKCVFSIKWVILLDLLLIIYAPLYLLLLRYLQKQVVKKLQHFLKISDYNFWVVMKCRVFPFSMKISTSKDYMWGAVEILDYKKDFDNWQSKDLFPFTLALGGRGSFYHPLHLNLKDPLVAGIHLAFHEILNDEDPLDGFELSLDREESLDKEVINFLLDFNRLLKRVDFGSFQDWFVDQMMRTITFVDGKNASWFNPFGFSVQFTAEIATKPVKQRRSRPQAGNTMTYILSQNFAEFNISDLRQIHRVHHFDPLVNIQFQLKITHKDHQTKKENISLLKEKRNAGYMRSSLESPLLISQRLTAEQLKEQLFMRLENQGRFSESPRDMNNNNYEEEYSNPESPKLKAMSMKPLKKTFGRQVLRVMKLVRYCLLGYRRRILHKYVLTASISVLLICDVALMIMVMIIENITRWMLNLPFPAAAYLVPLGELIWITGSSSVPMGKVLLTLNLMAGVNIIVSLIVSLEVTAVLWPLLLVKVLTGFFGCQYLSYIDNMKESIS